MSVHGAVPTGGQAIVSVLRNPGRERRYSELCAELNQSAFTRIEVEAVALRMDQADVFGQFVVGDRPRALGATALGVIAAACPPNEGGSVTPSYSIASISVATAPETGPELLDGSSKL